MNKKKNKVPLHPMERKISLKNMSDITWRIFRIMSEFVEGFEFLAQFRKEVTIFGSARLPKNSKWYKEAEKMGTILAKHGYTVITGGGPSIMEAGNKGAYGVDPNKELILMSLKARVFIIFLLAKSCLLPLPRPISFFLVVLARLMKLLK